jgi:hypothetical protein
LIVAEYAARLKNIVGRMKGGNDPEDDSALASEITIKPNGEAHGCPLC